MTPSDGRAAATRSASTRPGLARSVLALAAVAVTAAVGGCSSAPQSDPQGSAATPAPVTGTLTVFAAASLKSTFTTLGALWKKAHPGADVTFNFAGSSDLVTQITQGAPADVFASADQKNMAKVADAGLVAGSARSFATNTLTIVTPPGNPKRITSFADLAAPGTQVVVCAPQVPCGSAAEKIEKATGVTLRPVSEESSVTDVLGKITSGQADAGLVYVTDAKGAGAAVTAVPFGESGDAVNTYPIAVLAEAPNPSAAQTFVDLVTGAQGRDVLTAAGFAAP